MPAGGIVYAAKKIMVGGHMGPYELGYYTVYKALSVSSLRDEVSMFVIIVVGDSLRILRKVGLWAHRHRMTPTSDPCRLPRSFN